MEVFTQYFRRLLQSNASQIFSTSTRQFDGAGGTYQLLLNEVQKLNVDSDQATKIAESLDTTDGDALRDFDLSGFMDHFRLNPITKTALAVSCKSVSKPDIKAKGTTSLHLAHPLFANMLHSRCNPHEQFRQLSCSSFRSHQHSRTSLLQLRRNSPRSLNT